MIISFASGKGGTGKTTVATGYALLLSQDKNLRVRFLDCDVEEPNAAIFLKPRIQETVLVGIPVPSIDLKKCNFCGTCADICAYNAIAVIKPNTTAAKDHPGKPVTAKTKGSILTFPELCHGCGGCRILCPESAITEIDRDIGVVEKGRSNNIEFMQGRLNIGEPMATPLIRQMKRSIDEDDDRINLIDVPPGTSCPVVEAVKGSDFTVLVTEPTPFGLNDLVLAVETLKKLNIRMGIVINRSSGDDRIITEYCDRAGVPVLMKIPLSRDIAEAYSRGESFINLGNGHKERLKTLAEKIKEQVGGS
jgi:MinD superfamily P-loop ATPase